MISVLYVDDEPTLLDILKLMLEATQEFSVVTAISAEVGLKALRTGQYDAIISDYQMPVMDGIEFLKEVRLAFGDIPFIIFTGRGREEIVIEALNNGADFYLQKGGEPRAQFAELAHKIRSAVSRKKTEAALRKSRNFLDNVFTSIQDGISVIDRDMTLLRVNRTMELWYPDSVPLVGKKCYETYHGRSERCETCPSYETLISGKPAQGIVARTDNRNITAWYELFSYPLINSATGEMNGVIEYVRNITGKKVADDMLNSAYEKLTLKEEELQQQYFELARGQEQLQESEAQFRRIVEAAPWGMYIYELDTSGELILRGANTEANSIMGMDHSRHFGKSIEEIFPALVETDIPGRFRELATHGGQWINEQFAYNDGSTQRCFDICAFSIHSQWIVVAFEDVTTRKKAEDALAESERKFREIFDRANDGIHLHELREDGLPGKFIEMNQVACRMLQSTREELLSLSPLDFTTGFHSISLQQIGNDIITRGHAGFETEFLRKDGTTIPVDINAHVIDFMGKKTVLSVIRDISAQKEARLEIEKSKLHLEAIVQCSPVPMFVIDKEHRVISWNHALEELTKIKADDALGKAETGQVFYHSKHPCLADLIVEDNPDELVRIYKGKSLSSGYIRGAYVLTDFFPHINGGSWITITAAPVRDREGHIIGAVESLQDITRTRKTEEELWSAYEQMQAAFEEARMSQNLLQEQNERLNESESRFREIFNKINDAIEVHSLQPDGLPGSYIEVNDIACRMLQYTREEMLTRSPADITTGVYSRQPREIARDLSTCGHSQFETEFRRKDGTIVPVEVNAHMVTIQGRNLVLAVFSDISCRRQTEAVLHRINNQLGILSSVTRHDIVNKLTALQAINDLWKTKATDPWACDMLEKQAGALDAIHKQIEFTREYEELGHDIPWWQDIREVLSRVIVQLDPGTVSITVDIDRWEIYADAMLEKVFYNLAENALRHGRNITFVRFSSAVQNDCLVISCEDDGGGIPEDEKEVIMDRGYGKNTGLGLFLCKEILTITGITLLETGEPGKGARFEILVPSDAFRPGQKSCPGESQPCQPSAEM